jgi:acyl-CoA thioester hydrolase
MYGHVNNTVFYQWFDVIVNGWLIDRGLLDLGGGSVIGLVVETSCRYAKPLSYPELVDVGLSVKVLGSSSVTYGIGIFAGTDEEAAAEGTFTHVYVDRSSRRPVPLVDAWRRALNEIGSK